MELHNTKKKPKAPSKKSALLRVGSLVVSAAIALSPGVVPAMTSLRAMAEKGTLTENKCELPDMSKRENSYIYGLFYDELPWDSTELTDAGQRVIYDAVRERIISISDSTEDSSADDMTLTFTYPVSVGSASVRDEKAAGADMLPAPPDEEENTGDADMQPENPDEEETFGDKTDNDQGNAEVSTDDELKADEEQDEQPAENTPAASDDEKENSTDTPVQDTTGEESQGTPVDDTSADAPAENTVDPVAAAMTQLSADIKAVDLAIYDLSAGIYWFGEYYITGPAPNADNSAVTCTVNFTVNDKYRNGGENRVNAAVMNRARTAADKARRIASQAEPIEEKKSKAEYFCNSIYGLLSTAATAADIPETEMWGIVSVFNGDGASKPDDFANSLEALCAISNISGVICRPAVGSDVNKYIVTIDSAIYTVDLANYQTDAPLTAVDDGSGDNSGNESSDNTGESSDNSSDESIGDNSSDDSSDNSGDDNSGNSPVEFKHSDHRWDRNDEYHWIDCPVSDCEHKVSPAAHKWRITKTIGVTTAPTCTTHGRGTVEVQCEDCGYTANKDNYELPLKEHSMVWASDEEGYHWQECSDCHENRTERAAHNNFRINRLEATADTPGYYEKYCGTCQKVVERKVFPATGSEHKHNFNIRESNETHHWWVCECGVESQSRSEHKKPYGTKYEVITQATCGTAGSRYAISYCSECNREISRKVESISATGRHSYDKGVCVICGAKDSSYIAPHTHKASTTWVTDDRLEHWQICEVENCNAIMNRGPHTTDAGTVTYPATATRNGLRTYVCTKCGKVLATEVIPATGSSSSTSTTSSTSSSTSKPNSSSNTSSTRTSSSSSTYSSTSYPTSSVDPSRLNISQSTQSGANAPRAQIRSSNNTLYNALLSSYERDRVQNGESMTVRLTVDSIDYNVPANDRAAVERTLGTLSNFRVGQYLDINLFKTVGSDRKQILASINDLTITLDIPEDIRGKSSYSVVRVHDGNSTILPDLDSDPNTITIETSLFSTYAIIYRDQSSNANPGTGIAESPYIMSTIIGASAFIVMNVVISVVANKKRRTKTN